MSELLQFMYQGVVNVKHTELSSFMKIAQTLHIKGLAAQSHGGRGSSPSPALSQMTTGKLSAAGTAGPSSTSTEGYFSASNASSSAAAAAAAKRLSTTGGGEYGNGSAGADGPAKKHCKRTSDTVDHEMSGAESMENLSSDEVFMPTIPQITMVEANRFDLANVKRETDVVGGRNHQPMQSNYDYNGSSYGKGVEYPNELHMINDLNKPMGGGAGPTNCGSAAHSDALGKCQSVLSEFVFCV